ncbi:ABC transporter permease [Desulfonatronovibrio hydrogenovorans]|uniref:ABC transporter permease n=1 Tax=Desulfonatronovibrio hydrogenovorans TaxID=53245 RepID=UPI00048C4473|nr:ABC transporter permease [Desulfonatronovibrio hydrogenovorans]
MSFITFIQFNSGLILEYTLNHISLVLTVLVFSLGLWIFTGLVISRYDRLAGTIISLSNILFCIPSISLFGLLMTVPGLGLGRRTAVLVLVLYAMMPLVRSVYLGIKSVDQSVMEAGKGMGMTRTQILFRIQIPMAWPMVFTGIRVSLVLITGIATMATFIGEKNLGRLIHQGITRGNADMIIAGAIMVSIIALALDFIMGRIEKRIISPGLRYQAGDR